MFSALRNRLQVSPTMVIATLALLFAMTGGAYAAKKYLITSTKQISPSVLRSLQGKAGLAGANGAAGVAGSQGPAGAQGPAGTKGETGPAGTPGKDGPKGATGKEGAPGPEGPEGSPWTVNGTLPSEATETGTWWFQSTGAAEQFYPISFPIPLSVKGAEETTIHFSKEAGFVTSCPGTVNKPQAKPGAFCVYESVQTNFAEPSLILGADGVTEGKVGPSGVLFFYESVNSTRLAGGSFAVTAP